MTALPGVLIESRVARRYARLLGEKIVCLGCGLLVDGPGEWGCKCPPPSVGPRSVNRNKTSPPSSGSVYRALPPAAPCPRCGGRLAEASFHEAAVLDCTACEGLFLPKRVIDALTLEDGRALRLAFPWRERVPEPFEVRYLSCPICQGRMNRENFGMVSGVVVDVCKDDGVWFDAGEINAVIGFVEAGGLERTRQLKAEQRGEEKARLHEQWVREHSAAVRASALGPRSRARAEGDLVHALVRWFRR